MAAWEASLSLTSFYSPSSSTKLFSFSKTKQPVSIKLTRQTSASILLPGKYSLLSLLRSPISVAGKTKLCFSVQQIPVEEDVKSESENNPADSENPIKKKLYVANLPWSLTVVDIKSLFGQCGTVVDVEIIKQKDGRSRGFAFVTMESGETAQAVIDKFHLQDVSGRVIKVEFAKRFKKPSLPPPPGPQPGETRHKLYASNLEWKTRSTHLRDLLLAENFKPVSARVVFDGPKGRSSGYGFVSFATREEAEAALSSLDGKELMGRPLRLKFSEKYANDSENLKEEEVTVGETEEA